MSHVLSIQNLTKRYGDKIAVDHINFGVSRGEIVGLLGPNGAGKTTTINMLLGVLAPSEGSIHIDGIDLKKERSKALSRTNFAAVYAPLPGNLTVLQNLNVFGRLYGVKNLKARIETMIDQFELEAFRHTRCGVLSSGEQTRVCLAKALLNEPGVLLLDEPTASLDPSRALDIRERVKTSARAGVGVLWTSHNMLEVEQVCDRVMFISKGRVLLEGNPRTLPGEHGKSSLDELFIAVAREPLTFGEPHAA